METEQWISDTTLHGRVYQITKEAVYCDCLLDKDAKVFEQRDFPIYLFAHLPELQPGIFVTIRLRSKLGSMRIDIQDGTGIVLPETFTINFDDMVGTWDKDYDIVGDAWDEDSELSS